MKRTSVSLMRRTFAALILSVCCVIGVSAGETSDSTRSIVARVTDSLSTVVVEMPDALVERINGQAAQPQTEQTTEEVRSNRTASGRAVGYRVQIYSDNNQRSARAEAGRRAAAIRAHFPEYQTYVTFQSPYWRVRVGDFRSRSQAEDAAAQMRRVLPAYGKEMRVVKDRVNL